MENTRLNRYFIKQIALGCILMLSLLQVQAQRKGNGPWPDHAKAQFAGNIGFISIGAGFTNDNEKVEGDAHYGYVPESVGTVRIHSVTAKMTWYPFNHLENKKYQLKPFGVGLMGTYTFGDQYFSINPHGYDFTYYDFPTGFHGGFLVGGQINRKLNPKLTVKGIGVYYELVALDQELVSYLANTGSLKLYDIISIGIGVKTSF